MANEVCTSLGLFGKDLSGRLLQIVEKHGSNASFMICSLMWNCSMSETSVCLLSLHNSSSHYQNVCKKLGLNLKSAIEQKSVVILEPFNMYVEQTGDFDAIDMRNEDNLKRLFIDVKEALNSISGKKCLIIDDISDLMSLGSSANLVVAFLQYCRDLQNSDTHLGLLVCSHCSEENEDQKILCNFVAHVADYRITIAGLKTGFSSNVSGTLEVVDRLENNCITSSNVGSKLYHFKLTDRQVKVFAPGTVGIRT